MAAKTQSSNTNFELLLNEAETNFEASRYENAAKTFEHLMQMCIEKKYYEDMIYFSYRAIVSWLQGNQIKEVIRLYQKLAVYSLKLSTLQAISFIDTIIDLEDKAELIKLAQQNLKHLNDEEKRLPLIQTLIAIYEKFGADFSMDFKEKMVYLERAISLSKEINDQQKQQSLYIKLATLIEENSSHILESNGFDKELVAAHNYIDAAKYYHKASNMKKYDELITKSLELYPEIDLVKLNLPTVLDE